MGISPDRHVPSWDGSSSGPNWDTGGSILGRGLGDGLRGLVGGVTNAFKSVGSLLGVGTGVPPDTPEVFAPLVAAVQDTLAPILERADAALDRSQDALDVAQGVTAEMGELIDPENPESQLWVLQHQHNMLSDEMHAAHQETLRTHTEALREIAASEWKIMKARALTHSANEYLKVTYTRRSSYQDEGGAVGYRYHYDVEALGDWAGYVRRDGAIVAEVTPTNRFITEVSIAGTFDFFLEVQVANAESHYTELAGTSVTPPNGVWADVPGFTFTASVTSKHYITLRGQWSNATYVATYGIRILVDGVPRATRQQENIGPLIHHERRMQSLSTELQINTNQVVTLQAYAAHSNSLNRHFNRAEGTIGWVTGS